MINVTLYVWKFIDKRYLIKGKLSCFENSLKKVISCFLFFSLTKLSYQLKFG